MSDAGPLHTDSSYTDVLRTACLATCIISIVIITLLTAGRLAVKISVSRLQIEDYVLILATLLVLTYNGTVLVARMYGVSVKLESDDLEFMYLNISESLWLPAIAAAKTALSLQFRRLFCPIPAGQVWLVNTIIMYFNLIWITILFFLTILPCTPFLKKYDYNIEGHCDIDQGIVVVSSGVLNSFGDILLLILPLWAVWRLRMQVEKKLRVSAVFSIGLLACICSLFRLDYSVIYFHHQEDATKVYAVGLWASAELTAVLIVACFPQLPRFWKLFTNRHTGYTDGSGLEDRKRIGDAENIKHKGPPHGQLPKRAPQISMLFLTNPNIMTRATDKSPSVMVFSPAL